MKKILVPIGCRSDEGLSAPVIKRLKKYFDVRTVKLEPQNFLTSYQIIEYHCKCEPHIGRWDPWKPDLILITGDRVEMCAAAAAAFHNRIPIAHFYAGIINDPITTYDDIDRHCITLWSDIQLVESGTAYLNVEHFLKNAGREENCYVVGISHLDDIGYDEEKVPYDQVVDQPYKTLPYNLILYNTPTLYDPKDEIKEIRKIINEDGIYSILIGGNPDGEKEIDLMDDVNISYKNLSREQFLGLLKNCSKFITNSSVAVYEAPYFLKPEQIIQIGERNKNRGKVECKSGGSDNVVEVLKRFLDVR